MSMPHAVKLTDSDLPALYRSADAASRAARRSHSILTAIDLALLLLASILGSFVLASYSERRAVTIAIIIILALSVILAWAIRIVNLERKWYCGRAVAESTKSLAWRYMTQCQTYLRIKDAEADQMLTLALRNIVSKHSEFCSEVSGPLASAPEISQRMREVRTLDATGRRDVYVSQRLLDQVVWYNRQAETNRKWGDRLQLAMLASQALAVVTAILIAVWPDSPFNPVGLLVNLALVLLTWAEYRRHQELARSYGVTAENLKLTREEAPHIQTDEDLSDFVSESESAIESEHTLWLARRDRK